MNLNIVYSNVFFFFLCLFLFLQLHIVIFFLPFFLGEWKVETPYGFTVADAHVNLDSFDDFVINVNFDSDKIKHRKIHAEIANKPTAKTGRRIVVTVTSDGKNLVSGR